MKKFTYTFKVKSMCSYLKLRDNRQKIIHPNNLINTLVYQNTEKTKTKFMQLVDCCCEIVTSPSSIWFYNYKILLGNVSIKKS